MTRHDPLHTQILGDQALPQKNRGPKKVEREECQVVPERLTQKILQAVQDQAAEEDEDAMFLGNFDACSVASADIALEEEDDDEVADEDGYVFSGITDVAEEAAMAQFLPSGGKTGINLADLILQKIAEKQAQGEPVTATTNVSPKVVAVYSQIGKWMQHYKSGKVPKAFKIIPNLANWEQVLYLTNPLEWSPSAMREATKIFAANLNQKMAQRFYNLVLLPAVREDIATNHRLNYHYYEALKKALFKPSAWFKGILLPLAEENCTMREAIIVSSVLSKVSVPVMHASAAFIKLASMQPWYGTTSIFMTTLLSKKYALPYRVISEAITHFMSFMEDTRELPVVWHRALLVLVQKYKYDITDPQKKAIKDLLKAHPHEIGHEVRRELFSAPPRELRAAAASMIIG